MLNRSFQTACSLFRHNLWNLWRAQGTITCKEPDAMRLICLRILVAQSALACTCLGAPSPCDSLGPNPAILVVRVVEESRPGHSYSRVTVGEPVLNAPRRGSLVDIDDGRGNSCGYSLASGRRCVLVSLQRSNGIVKVGACSGSFEVDGNEQVLEVLRLQARGGPPQLFGAVLRNGNRHATAGGIPGARVSLQGEGVEHVVITDDQGRFPFPDLAPGLYRIEASREGFVPDRAGPDNILIQRNQCTQQELSMWPDGRISGRLRDDTGEPVPGVVVEAYRLDEQGDPESSAMRRATSTPDGRFELDCLPTGDYLIGVDANPFWDNNPYPPTLYRGAHSSGPAPVHIAESASVTGIDLNLAPGGQPLKGVCVKLTDPAGESALVLKTGMYQRQRLAGSAGLPG